MLKTLGPLWPYLWRYRRSFALGLLALALKDVAAVSAPLVIRAAVDGFSLGAPAQRIWTFAAYLTGIAIVRGIFQYWMRVVLIGISRDIEYDLRSDLFTHLFRYRRISTPAIAPGTLWRAATNDLNAVRMMLGPGVMYWTETSLTFILAIAVMSTADWRLTLLAILPAPLVSFAVIFFGAKFTTVSNAFRRCSPISAAVCRRIYPASA